MLRIDSKGQDGELGELLEDESKHEMMEAQTRGTVDVVRGSLTLD